MRMNDPETGRIELAVRVNGEEQYLQIEASSTLLEVIRDQLGYTGAKQSCAEQRCGACTVLVGGLPVSACNYLAYEVDRAEVLTIEGLETDGELDVVQRMFIEQGAVQCGFCTPGMIMTARALINDFQAPSEELIRGALVGNLCRCTGYETIVRAVKLAGESEASP